MTKYFIFKCAVIFLKYVHILKVASLLNITLTKVRLVLSKVLISSVENYYKMSRYMENPTNRLVLSSEDSYQTEAVWFASSLCGQ